MENNLAILEFFQANYVSAMMIGSLTVMRPLGFTLSFICIVWALPQASIIRIAISFAIALPLMWSQYDKLIEQIQVLQWLDISVFFLKELVIGYSIGLLASIPFWIIQISGTIIDTYRGEINPGSQDPTGGEIPTLARLQLVSAFLIFFALGGMWFLIDVIYKSYEIWPLTSSIPQISAEAASVILKIFDTIIVMSLVIAAPIIFIMVAIDLAVILAGKIAKGFSPLDVSFALKNTITLLTLPLVVMVLTQYLEQDLLKDIAIFDLLRQVLS